MLCGVAVKRRHFLAYKARSQIDTRDHATKLSKIKFRSPCDQRLPISETSNSIRSIRPVNWVERKIFIFFRQDRRLPEISSSAANGVNVKRIPNRVQGPYRKKIKNGQFPVSESLKNPAVGTSGRFVDDPGRRSSEADVSLLFAPQWLQDCRRCKRMLFSVKIILPTMETNKTRQRNHARCPKVRRIKATRRRPQQTRHPFPLGCSFMIPEACAAGPAELFERRGIASA